jgi:nucleotide-binding universal stress UspA family protein
VLDARGIGVATKVFPDEQAPWRSIIEVADDIDASAIVADITEQATAHHGALGSQARALAHRAHRPLLLLPADALEADAAAPAVFAYDGSEPAADAVRVAS